MREGIMEQIAGIPSDVRVLVIGASRIPDLSGFNQTIGRLNHPVDWIDCECEDHIPTSRLKSKHGLLLIMSSTRGPVLVNMKKAARAMNIPYLNQALTTGEVKQVLNHLYTKRSLPHKKKEVDQNGSANGSVLEGSVNQELKATPLPVIVSPQVEVPLARVPLQSTPGDLASTLKQIQDLAANEQLLAEENIRLTNDLRDLQNSNAEKELSLKAALEEIENLKRQIVKMEKRSGVQKSEIEGLEMRISNLKKVTDSIEGLAVSAKRI